MDHRDPGWLADLPLENPSPASQFISPLETRTEKVKAQSSHWAPVRAKHQREPSRSVMGLDLSWFFFCFEHFTQLGLFSIGSSKIVFHKNPFVSPLSEHLLFVTKIISTNDMCVLEPPAYSEMGWVRWCGILWGLALLRVWCEHAEVRGGWAQGRKKKPGWTCSPHHTHPYRECD
jgi:hypothetical protein